MGNQFNPYIDDGIVYTVETLGNYVKGAVHTGRFIGSHDRPFWTMEVVGRGGERNASDWIDINPAHIVCVYAAAGKAYETFIAAFGEDA